MLKIYKMAHIIVMYRVIYQPDSEQELSQGKINGNLLNLTSPRGITDVINGKGDSAGHKTVDKYIDYLCRAFAFYKVRRYDICRKKYLVSTEWLL